MKGGGRVRVAKGQWVEGLLRPSSAREEWASVMTHAFGLLLSAGGFYFLVAPAVAAGERFRIVSTFVFGIALVLMYGASTVYHGVRKPRIKRILQIVDHVCIYLLIAGTYTPFLAVHFEPPRRDLLLGLVWGLALVGTVYKIFFIGRAPLFSTFLYLAMGWMAVFAAQPLLHALPPGGLAWLVAGGLLYSAGTIFFLWERLPYNHAIWHLFVLGGSICHYLAVTLYVVPT